MGEHKRRKRVSKGKEKIGRPEERRFRILVEFCILLLLRLLSCHASSDSNETNGGSSNERPKTLNLLYASVSLGKHFCDFLLPRTQSPASMSVGTAAAASPSSPSSPSFPSKPDTRHEGRRGREKVQNDSLEFHLSLLEFPPPSSFLVFLTLLPFPRETMGERGGESKVSSP